MKSITIRNTNIFDINESDGSLPLTKNDVNTGTIAKESNTYNSEGVVFDIYQCSFFVEVKDTIIVQVDGQTNTVDEYQKSSSFKAYYVRNENLLFVDAATTIAKKFLDALQNQYPNKVQTKIYNFDFQAIGEYQNNTKAIYFAVDDNVVDNKIFFGNGVDQNTEATEAIDNSQATYLMAEIDLRQVSRTIGFSKKGAAVIYSKPLDLEPNFEAPYLQLAYDSVQKFPTNL